MVTAKAVIPKRRFLIRLGDTYKTVNTTDIAYIFSEEGLSFAYTFDKVKYILDLSLSELSTQLDSNEFFRINRNSIVNIRSIQKINSWFNNRLKLALTPETQDIIVVSRERVKNFKAWLGA